LISLKGATKKEINNNLVLIFCPPLLGDFYFLLSSLKSRLANEYFAG